MTPAENWYVCELRRIRAMVRIGTISDPNALKARREYQRELAKLRAARASK